MRLTRVDNCLLRLDATADQDELAIPVSSFSLSFEINKLPQAVITPAFGRNFRTGAITSLQDALEGRTGTLAVMLGETTHVMLEGYIGVVSAARSAAVTGADSFSAQITLNHKLELLAGSPAGSMTYASSLNNPVQANIALLAEGLFGVSEKLITESWEKLAQALYVEQNPSALAFLYPGHIIRDMAIAAVQKTMPDAMSAEELRYRIQVYASANMTGFGILGEHAARQQALMFQRAVLDSNLWQAVDSTAQEFFLNIMPFSMGIALGNPVAALDAEQLVINASEIIGVQASRAQTRPEKVQGVIVEMTSGDKEGKEVVTSEINYLSVFPPFLNSDGSVVLNIYDTEKYKGRGGHYRWWKAPKWLDGTGMELSTKQRHDGKARLSTVAQSPSARQHYLSSLGPILAIMIYAQLMRDNLSVPELVFPFRTDIMPGTTIKLINGSDVLSGLGFSGRDWYGMVDRVRFDLSNEGDPMLQTTVGLSYTRATQTLPGTQQMGYNEGSIFEAPWNGIKLDGSALTEAPDATAFPATPKL